jgi:hypothetical protein
MERATNPHDGAEGLLPPGVVASLIRRTGLTPSVALRTVRSREAEGLSAPAFVQQLAGHARAAERLRDAARRRVVRKPAPRRAFR